ncbi:MAG: transcriptional regulator [Novosphingobium pentaromativorans]|uniref:Transcriptional regulator n=1 Tax=Novosphingobium pentaromativorans TaxID=205844 RepID=A0A2W5NWC0_9SPHN|nr:MAG: transcriptional regulator [Novosphingobium pentaromativorans]
MNAYPTPSSSAHPGSEGGIGRFMRRKEVELETGLSRPTIYRQMASGTFPKPRRIGVQAVAWLSTEIEEWKRQRPFANHEEQ